ncbi:MAG: EF-hand domain-containing protein [Alphaproteobacteria bacterium]|nr:EF-hand domain-containing protein [Alphaproteobacteria bacterium]
MKRVTSPLLALVLAISLPTLAHAKEDHRRALLKENFEQADSNGDSALSRNEFEVFVNANAEDDLGRARLVKRLGAYENAFSKMDRDGDGLVSKDDIEANR